MAAFTFWMRKAKSWRHFDDVDFRSAFRNATALKAQSRIAKTSLRDRFFLERLESPLRYAPTGSIWRRSPRTADGGEVTGRFTMHPQERKIRLSPSSVKFRDLAGRPNRHGCRWQSQGMVQGKLEGNLERRRQHCRPKCARGSGEIYSARRPSPAIQPARCAGTIFANRRAHAAAPRSSRGEISSYARIGTIDELLLRSPNIRLSATGTVTFDGKAASRIAARRERENSQSAFQPIRENFQADQRCRRIAAVDFQVSGTVGRPKDELGGETGRPGFERSRQRYQQLSRRRKIRRLKKEKTSG